jgi:hypothetical protein
VKRGSLRENAGTRSAESMTVQSASGLRTPDAIAWSVSARGLAAEDAVARLAPGLLPAARIECAFLAETNDRQQEIEGVKQRVEFRSLLCPSGPVGGRPWLRMITIGISSLPGRAVRWQTVVTRSSYR